MSFSVDVKNEIKHIEPKHGCCVETLTNCFDIDKLQDGMKGKCCVKVFLRYAFIIFGTVNDPEKSYHLELSTEDEELAILICTLMNDYNMGAKVMMRNGFYVTYIKGSDAISDFLILTGANNAVMIFENVRIVKEMRNNINRSINCESANIQKKIDAAFHQIECINFIKSEIGLNNLTDDLKELAELRLKHHDMGLTELGENLERKIGKSGVSHRMRKIINIAEQLKERNKSD